MSSPRPERNFHYCGGRRPLSKASSRKGALRISAGINATKGEERSDSRQIVVAQQSGPAPF